MITLLDKNYYTVEESAEKLKKSSKTILRMIKDKRLEANTKSRPYLVSEDSLKKYLENK